MAEREDLATVRLMVKRVAAKRMDVFDCNPWNAPTIKNMIYDESFLTLVTKRSLYEDPRPLPPDALESALDMVTQMCRTGLAMESNSAFNLQVADSTVFVYSRNKKY